MEKGLNRRRFFGAAIGTGAAAAAAGAPAALGHGSDWGWHSQGSVPRNRRGIQLYTMRRQIDDLGVAPADVFRALGHMGYTEVEMAGHYDLPVEELRRQLGRAGLRPVSGHDGPAFPAEAGWQDEYRETLEYAVELGQKYTGLAWWEGPYNDEALWHQLAEHLNEAGTIAKDEFGLQFFYHNHDFEFSNRQASGAPMYDILLEETNREYVLFQLDLYWITEGGANGVEYLSADPARYFSYHVKDHVWGDRRKADGTDEADFEDVGPGMLDFPDLFDAGDGRWLDKHYIIEHDSPWLSHPDDDYAEFKTAQAGIEYLRKVRW